MKFLVCFLFFNLGVMLYGQNLVPNGSFEDYSSCPPTSISSTGRVDLLNNWTIPSSGGSPDFFSSCHVPLFAGISVDVPSNMNGNESARTGDCYAGFYPRSECVEIALSSSLIAGDSYDFEMYVSLADFAQESTDGLGVFFSTGPTTSLTRNGNAQISNSALSFITNASGWTLISGTYVASGGENYIAIGNFSSSFYATTNAGGSLAESYYYLDDVSLINITVLPIELVSFIAESNGDEVSLNWATSSEINNDYFTIERSLDGVSFEEVETHLGAGNSNVEIHYSTVLEELNADEIYYRLKQTDFNGDFMYSSIISVNMIREIQLSIYPNPVVKVSTLIVNSIKSDQGKMIVTNIEGKTVNEKNFELHTGINKIQLDFLNFKTGIYFVKLITDSGLNRVEKIYKK